MDAHEEPDQGKISQPLVERVLTCGTGPGGNMTPRDLSKLLGQRRVEAKNANPEYSQALIHKLFGSSKYIMSPITISIFITDVLPAVLQRFLRFSEAGSMTCGHS